MVSAFLLMFSLVSCNQNPYAGETGAMPVAAQVEAYAAWLCRCSGPMSCSGSDCESCLISMWSDENQNAWGVDFCVNAELAESCLDTLSEEACPEDLNPVVEECNPWANMVECP